ncbi:hypothetical protein BHE90_010203 [Fusarium euwallaceae]|uniref:Uncharacterized protein n=3 Tax=Fusarium solani species complex TaxID=232080 RepID=A0A3M2SBN4_9HYPO|nr:hypothetical protein CDV36_005383 [Fusarium kuroshium]RSL97627.1 hypothetical protein CDV31_012953 [Fusarium ambrosium]RTE75346.1 hypothetical protein BHE90_010203 [Fusarium euwallaceae]
MRFAPILALVAVAAATQTPVATPIATPGPHTNGTTTGSGSEPTSTDGVPSPNGAVSFGAQAGLAGVVGAVAAVLAL